jgi:DNA-binding transcriptional regulator GbsR (MarR family)
VSASGPSKKLASFFEMHILGIMAQFAAVINDSKGRLSALLNLEKKRCLRAIEEMLRLAKSNISNGLPQVRPIGLYTLLSDKLTCCRYVLAYNLPLSTAS